MKKYTVEIKAKRTGEWYVKTETDSYASARSVALVSSMGRATRIIHNDSGRIEDVQEGDSE